MSEQVDFMLPLDEHFNPDTDQYAYNREFYAIAAAEEGGFDDVFGSDLTVEVDTKRLMTATNAPNTFSHRHGPNTDTDPGKTDGD